MEPGMQGWVPVHHGSNLDLWALFEQSSATFWTPFPCPDELCFSSAYVWPTGLVNPVMASSKSNFREDAYKVDSGRLTIFA